MKTSTRTALMLLLVIMGLGKQNLSAQSVIFPQQNQPGTAVATQNGDTYTLANDLLSASFTKANGRLTFAGCDALYLTSSTELFKVTLGNGTVVPASAMTLGEVTLNTLTGNATAVRGSERFDGKELVANYTYGNLSMVWRAVLRDGSHYLRTELDLTANADQAMTNVIPMLYAYDTDKGGEAPAIIGNTRGAVLANDKIFAGLETPMGINSVLPAGSDEIARDNWTTTVTESGWIFKKYTYTDDWSSVSSAPSGIGVSASKLKMRTKNITVSDAGTLTITLDFTASVGGDKKYQLNTAGVDVLDASGNVVASDYHTGRTGDVDENNVYTLKISNAGSYTVRCFANISSEIITSNGTISFVYSSSASSASQTLQGLWSRATTLQSGKTWNVSAVVGIVAPGQQRRSFLAYSERERAVPWRPYPLYNSWYELGIDRNNASNPENNMKASDCLKVVNEWKSKLYDQYNVAPEVFVWDDGWDNYKDWGFHSNFSNGFKDFAAVTNQMDAHQGAWLGPVGGYGVSGDKRRSYWTSKGGMNLSNPAYYTCFLNAVTNLVNNHDVRFFKFDGISTISNATGPDGEEDAEGIINIEREARKIKEDLFINTTVGTWASPFWYRFTDATWRQEQDYGEIGNGSTDRENWITYRDRLVYQNYVQNSPLCPINTLMTHGVIVTTYGDVATNFDYAGVLREIRCAFACGSGMVELYCDKDKLNSINGGALWGDIADCIKWQKENADVLPDAHWVGGNPWDGSQNNVYGWASWNGQKATLALRNPSTSKKTFTFTLREVLDIPSYFTTPITLTKAFAKDADLSGLTTGEALDLDQQITVTLAASSVYVYNGNHGSTEPEPVPTPSFNLTADETATAFGEVTTGETYTRTITVKGENLQGDITVASSADAVLVPATTTITKAQAEAGFALTVSLKPTAVAENATATLTLSTEGAEEQQVTFSWTAVAPVVVAPSLSVEVGAYSWDNVITGSTYEVDMTVKGAHLTGDITAASDNNAVTLSATTISQENGMSENGYSVKVTLIPTQVGEGTANITFSTDGAESVVKTITWTAKAPEPAPSDATLSVVFNKESFSAYTDTKYTVYVTIQGENLTGDITVTSDNEAVTPAEATISPEDGMTASGYMTTLTLCPTEVGEGTANITFSTNGATDVVKTITWTAEAPSRYETVTRTIKVNSGSLYGTLILPFSIGVPSGVRAFVITSIEEDGSLVMKEKYFIMAFRPYMIYSKSGVEKQVTGRFLHSAREKYENVHVDQDYFMGGVLFEDARITFGPGEYVLQNQTGNGSRFYDAEGMTFNVPVSKCFLKIPEESQAPGYRFVIDGETGLVLPSFEEKSSVDVIFNLQGQRVTETQPGNIYIINGKKVLVK